MTDTIPVRVAVRVRPLSQKELTNGCLNVLEVVPGRPQILTKGGLEKAFTFDYVFGPEILQEPVYEVSVNPLINQLFKGYNATVLAYGQTGSGKTHTMGTTAQTYNDQEGIIPRAVKDIFTRMISMQDYTFSVRIAFIELYKEQLYDLLSAKGKKKDECVVDIREDPKVGIVVTNLTEIPVNNLEATMKQLEIGSEKRVTAATAMNSVSSRSHAIFTLMIEGTRRDPDEQEDEDRPTTIISKFTLVDLAGSERSKKTLATGDRQKEGVAINLGLLALGQVISCLGDSDAKRSHIPYRDSKLTRLLQDSLGGNSYTLMIACVSPADSNIDETLNTLRYADRARKIKNLPIVNRDVKDREISNLRKEIAQLRAQLGKAPGSELSAITRMPSFNGEEKEEFERLKEVHSLTLRENYELTNALNTCQTEIAMMSEKLVLYDDTVESMTTKLKKLQSKAQELLEKPDVDASITEFLNLINNLVVFHKAAGKSFIDFEATRFTNTDSSSMCNEDNQSSTDQELADEEDHDPAVYASNALKRNVLNDQLSSLNKILAQKEQLAFSMDLNEEKIVELRKKYEESIKTMEKEMEDLTKEKENLQHQVKTEPVSKIAEQRRKRIQELEHSIQDLRKKVLEQERIIKLNEKNAKKVQQLAEEIRTAKQQKVKLIKQMREESEQVRVYKQGKEREVSKLKQTERKQQFQIAKMESLHTKQTNVLKRKMEEAMCVNKRLKEAIEKQKAARKYHKESSEKSGLAGSAERMRNLMTQELDMAVSVKEATQSRIQLIEDRKILMKQINDLRKQTRYTMLNSERDEVDKKIQNLESELVTRNDQIMELQKQIMSADQDKEKEGGRNWWDTSIATMTDAKIALQYLFEKSADNMLVASTSTKELTELRQLYEEAVRNITNLEEEINQMKNTHSDELMKASKDYEEQVAVFLNQLTNKDADLKDADFQKFSKIHKELLKMRSEAESRKSSKNVLNKKRSAEINDRYTPDEYFEENDSDEDELDPDDDQENDPEWVKTPLFRRLRKLREANSSALNVTANLTNRLKRKVVVANMPDIVLNEDDESSEEPSSKRISGGGGCACKTGCKSNRCACKKTGKACDERCRCPNDQCQNKFGGQSPPGPRRESLNDISSADNTAGTMSLLNETFDVSTLGTSKLQIPSASFKRAANEQELAATSPYKKPNLFKSPLRT